MKASNILTMHKLKSTLNRIFTTTYCFKIRHISTKGSDQNLCWPGPDYGPLEVQRSVLLNGIKVAAAKPLGAEISACTIMYQIGSRHEVDDELGATHFLRALSGCSGCGYSAFAKSRFLQQNGGSITCSSDRQNIAFTLRCPLVVFNDLKPYLLDVACRPCFENWEVNARKGQICDDLHRMPPEQRVLDLVQRASWGGSLANSIFCEKSRIGSMSGGVLNCFASKNYRSNICTVASVGIPFEETMKFAESIEYCRDLPPPRPVFSSFPRRGFEYYDLGLGSTTWIALAVPGTGTCDVSCLMKHALVASACGVGDMQGGQHAHDRTPMPPLGTMAGDDIYTNYRAFNISYYETGVFGIVAKTTSAGAWKTAVSASEFLINIGDLTFCQIEVGRKRLKVNLTLHDEDCVRVSEGLALQLANDVQINNCRQSIALIDSISNDEVSYTAKMIASKCAYMAYAVVGDVTMAPHDREITCCNI